MKKIAIILFGLALVGCASSQPRASLTAEQATALAMRLANDKACTVFHRQPFHDPQPARFDGGRWVWRQLTPGDIEATVELAADGSTNSVILNLLSNTAY